MCRGTDDPSTFFKVRSLSWSENWEKTVALTQAWDQQNVGFNVFFLMFWIFFILEEGVNTEECDIFVSRLFLWTYDDKLLKRWICHPLSDFPSIKFCLLKLLDRWKYHPSEPAPFLICFYQDQKRKTDFVLVFEEDKKDAQLCQIPTVSLELKCSVFSYSTENIIGTILPNSQGKWSPSL